MPSPLAPDPPPLALIGYARVSTDDQSLSPQRDALRAAGCTEMFEEFASGAQRSRPQLAAALARVRRGDTLLVARIDRSVAHPLAVIEALEAKGSHFRSLHDPVDTSSSQGMFSLQVLGATAQLRGH